MAICLPGIASKVKRRNFSDTTGTLCNNDEVDDDEDRKDNQTDGKVTANDELTKRLNNFSSGLGPVVSAQKN